MCRYTEEDIIQAVLDVAGGQSLRRAALNWGVPRTTLQSRLQGHEPRRQAAASLQRLSPEQEARLTTWVLTQEALGLPPTHAQIKIFAQRILATKGDLQPVG